MSANARSDMAETVLLMIGAPLKVFPMSTVALTQAQAPQKNLQAEYHGARILFNDGTLRKIENVAVLGPYGENWLRRIFSRLTNGWQVAVSLSDPYGENTKKLAREITEALTNLWTLDEELDETERHSIISSINQSSTGKQIYDALRLPSPSDALDVL